MRTLFAASLVFVSLSACEAAVIRVPADHSTIRSAIDAASPGDAILVSAGTWRERLKLKPGVTLRSAGDDAKGKLGLKRAEATIIDGGGAEGKGAGVLMAAGATLDGFTVTRVGLYDDDEWKKHHATHGENQSHEHIGHYGSPAIGIVGIRCTVTGNIVHHNGDTGIGVRGAKGRDCSPDVTKNVCYRNMGGGIGSMEGSTARIDSNICFENFYAGIGHDDASPIVTRNDCYENIRAGIGISHGASPVVRNNRCYRNRRAGIGSRTTNRTRPIIEQNECFENEMAGIGSEEDASPIIRGNKCHHNRMAGIGSRKGATALIVDNDCYENQLAGIGTDNGAHSVVVRNRSLRNQTAGIGLQGPESSSVIVGNRCVENRLVALGLPDGASAVIAQNHFERTGGQPPLVAVKGGAKGIVVQNTFQGGGVAGLLLQGTSLVADNDFSGRGEGQGSAVWVWKDSKVSAVGNRFDGYGTAVNAAGSEIRALDNQVRRFGQVAIKVGPSGTPAIVAGNVAHSDSEVANPFQVTGEGHVLMSNRQERTRPEPKAEP